MDLERMEDTGGGRGDKSVGALALPCGKFFEVTSWCLFFFCYNRP